MGRGESSPVVSHLAAPRRSVPSVPFPLLAAYLGALRLRRAAALLSCRSRAFDFLGHDFASNVVQAVLRFRFKRSV